MAKTRRISLHLAKSIPGDHKDLLSDRALELLNSKTAFKFETTDFGDKATLFLFPPAVGKEPKWVNDVCQIFNVDDATRKKLKAQSPAGLYIFEAAQSCFAATFSYAHSYLKNSRFVDDFGLKTSVNFIADAKVREVEKTNLGAAIKDFAQSPTTKDIDVFDVGDILDIVRRVTGEGPSDNNAFAKRVSGSRALKFTREMDVDEIPQLAQTALNLYNSNAYKKTKFEIIDFLAPVQDELIIGNLNDKLIHTLRKKNTDNFGLSMPEIAANDVGSYKYAGVGKQGTYFDVDLAKYLDLLGAKLPDLTIDTLKKHKINRLSVDDTQIADSASVYRSIFGSTDLCNIRYIMNEGRWYSFQDSESNSVDYYLNQDKVDPRPELPIYKTIDKEGKIHLSPESEWNAEAAKALDCLLMDAKNVQIPGQATSKFELCDILDLENRCMIHVKRSFRKSAPLSHLFKQGYNSALALRTDETRIAAVEKVREAHGDEAANRFSQLIMKPDDWTIEFWLADVPKANGSVDIPFFSKLTYRSERNKIRPLGFKVGISFIQAKPPT